MIKILTLSLGVKSRHNSGNATRCQTQIARLLSRAHMLKINRDHPARLVPSNRENFRILTVRRYDTFSLPGGTLGVPPRPSAQLITLSSSLIIPDITKTSSNNCLLLISFTHLLSSYDDLANQSISVIVLSAYALNI